MSITNLFLYILKSLNTTLWPTKFCWRVCSPNPLACLAFLGPAWLGFYATCHVLLATCEKFNWEPRKPLHAILCFHHLNQWFNKIWHIMNYSSTAKSKTFTICTNSVRLIKHLYFSVTAWHGDLKYSLLNFQNQTFTSMKW